MSLSLQKAWHISSLIESIDCGVEYQKDHNVADANNSNFDTLANEVSYDDENACIVDQGKAPAFSADDCNTSGLDKKT